MSIRGVNKVILIGNLGTDPEIRYMPSGSRIANLSIATNYSWKDKQTGELQERTEWHKILLPDGLAQIAADHLKKGAKVYIEGSIRTRKWQDQSGQDRSTTEIVASTMQMLDSKEGKLGKNSNFTSESNNLAEPHRNFKNTENQEEKILSSIEDHDEIPF